jgi:uncharacterized iron-regulated protein
MSKHQPKRCLAQTATGALMLGYMLLAACAATAWRSPFGRDHPLSGRIWDVSAAEFIDARALMGRLARADFILLGEQHDNPDHHLLQARILKALVDAGRRPVLAFEMLNLDNAAAVTGYLETAPKDASGFGPAVRWNQRGWPEWAMYQPIAEVALGARLPIVATNLPDALVTAMSRNGVEALEPGTRRALALDRPLADATGARLTADIRDSHCGYVPDERLKTMVAVQRARDALIAHSLLSGGNLAGAVLIAGAGHVRKDYAVPTYLTAKAPNKRVISVAFLEVVRGKTAPVEYAPAQSEGRLPFDYVWFTPRADDRDPCEQFREQLERLRERR